MKLTEDKLRNIIREEIQNQLAEEYPPGNAPGIKNISWEGLKRNLKDVKSANVYMSMEGDSIVVDLGRSLFKVPVDRTREPIYR